MRTKPLIGEKLWFVPRRFGWGWAPVTAEGWAVVVIATVAIIVLSVVMEPADTITPVFGLVSVLVVVCWLKGTSPGGPAARRLMDIQAERESEHGTQR